MHTRVTVGVVWSGLEAGFGGDQGCDVEGGSFPDLLLLVPFCVGLCARQ